MQADKSVSVLARIKAIASGARGANKIGSRCFKRDSLEDARKKVVDKLIANRDYFTEATDISVDRVYVKQADNNYGVGVKYGNRYLDGLFDGGNFVEGVTEEELADVLNTLAECATSGDFDAAIAKVMASNVAARSTKKH